jgi:hypothetical protein
MPKFKPARPPLPRSRVVSAGAPRLLAPVRALAPVKPGTRLLAPVRATIPTQRGTAPVTVKPILPPKPKLRNVLRPKVRPLAPATVPTQRPLPRPASMRPTPGVLRMGMRAPRSAAPMTERAAAPTLVRPVAPPVVRLRNVLRPVAKPLAVVPSVQVSRATVIPPVPPPVSAVRAVEAPSPVPVIMPPAPTVRMGLKTSAPLMDGQPHQMIRYATPAAADYFAAQEYDAALGGQSHGLLRLVRSQYGRTGRRGYGAPAPASVSAGKYKVTSSGWVWRYDFFNPSDADDVTALFNGSDEIKYVYSAGTVDAENLRNSTVAAYESWSGALSRAKAVRRDGSGSTPSASTGMAASLALRSGDVSAGFTPSTGYYTDTGGYAWYYNAAGDYLEAIAAPKGKYTSQPKFTSSTSNFQKMKDTVLKQSNATTRAAAISNATAAGGVELPATSRSSGGGNVQSQPPKDVANRDSGGNGDEGFFSNLTQQVWFWPAAILVPTAGIIAGILLIPSKKKAAAPAAPVAPAPTLVPA